MVAAWSLQGRRACDPLKGLAGARGGGSGLGLRATAELWENFAGGGGCVVANQCARQLATVRAGLCVVGTPRRPWAPRALFSELDRDRGTKNWLRPGA